jgi:hypothetical protein
VDESPVLTPKQKLLYLLTHLKSEAYEKVSALPIVDDSYHIALCTLKNRYSNPRLAARVHFTNLLQLPAASIKSSASIRKLLDSFNVNFSALSALNITDIYQSIYASFVLSKLDLPLRERFEASVTDKTNLHSVKETMIFLTAMAEQKEQGSLESALSALPSTSHQRTHNVSFAESTPLAVSTLYAEVIKRTRLSRDVFIATPGPTCFSSVWRG